MKIEITRLEVDDSILYHRKIPREKFRELLKIKLQQSGFIFDIEDKSEKDCLFFINRERRWEALIPENVPIHIKASITPNNEVSFGSDVIVGSGVVVGGTEAPTNTKINHEIHNIIVNVARSLWDMNQK